MEKKEDKCINGVTKHKNISESKIINIICDWIVFR